jgi:hypothetical protein
VDLVGRRGWETDRIVMFVFFRWIPFSFLLCSSIWLEKEKKKEPKSSTVRRENGEWFLG